MPVLAELESIPTNARQVDRASVCGVYHKQEPSDCEVVKDSAESMAADGSASAVLPDVVPPPQQQ